MPDPRVLRAIVERVRGVFDLAADPMEIARRLGPEAWLAPLLERHPGIRTPARWETVVSGRYGLNRLFPTPSQLAHAPL